MIGAISIGRSRCQKNLTAQIKVWTRGSVDPSSYRRCRSRFFTTGVQRGGGGGGGGFFFCNIHRNAVAVEGPSGGNEDSFEDRKNESGLDHNESRSWHGWHRHVRW